VGLSNSEIKIYILIDEYDNFANGLLANHGPEIYRKLTHEAGFFKLFFNNLKLATTGVGSCVERIFITGVSPVTMDDVTSGFNIGNNISLDGRFNNILGFSEQEVTEMVEYYLPVGITPPPTTVETPYMASLLCSIMKQWYDNYVFSSESNDSVYNTDGVLYFLNKTVSAKQITSELIDENLRLDYQKLRYLVLEEKKLNGNFSVLTEIIENGGISSKIKKSFPFDRISYETNFISLLYFLGLLTFSGHKIDLDRRCSKGYRV
jgi:hypothetical protein